MCYVYLLVCVYGACANGLMFMGLYICIRIRLREGGGEGLMCACVKYQNSPYRRHITDR